MLFFFFFLSLLIYKIIGSFQTRSFTTAIKKKMAKLVPGLPKVCSIIVLFENLLSKNNNYYFLGSYCVLSECVLATTPPGRAYNRGRVYG
jgi:hypothetical protein